MGQVSRLAPKTLPLRPHCPARCGAAALPLCHLHGASRASACACSPHRCFDEAHRHEASSMIAPLCAGMLACIEPQVPRTPTSCTGQRRSLADWASPRPHFFRWRTGPLMPRTISSWPSRGGRFLCEYVWIFRKVPRPPARMYAVMGSDGLPPAQGDGRRRQAQNL